MSIKQVDQLLSGSVPLPGNYKLVKAAASLGANKILDVGFGKGGAAMSFAIAGSSVDGLTVGDLWGAGARNDE